MLKYNWCKYIIFENLNNLVNIVILMVYFNISVKNEKWILYDK